MLGQQQLGGALDDLLHGRGQGCLGVHTLQNHQPDHQREGKDALPGGKAEVALELIEEGAGNSLPEQIQNAVQIFRDVHILYGNIYRR